MDKLEKTKKKAGSVIFRHWLIKKYPKIALWVWNKRRGECKNCGSCCNLNGKVCPYRKDSKCSVYKIRPLSCEIAPFPFDLWFDKRYNNCGIYYFKKPKEKNSKVNKNGN
jgi:hypothetical protein